MIEHTFTKLTVVSIGAFLVFFSAFSYSGVYFQHVCLPALKLHTMDNFEDQLIKPLYERNLLVLCCVKMKEGLLNKIAPPTEGLG